MPVKAPYEGVDMNQVVDDNINYEDKLRKKVNMAGYTGIVSGILAGIFAVIVSIFLVIGYFVKG